MLAQIQLENVHVTVAKMGTVLKENANVQMDGWEKIVIPWTQDVVNVDMVIAMESMNAIATGVGWVKLAMKSTQNNLHAKVLTVMEMDTAGEVHANAWLDMVVKIARIRLTLKLSAKDMTIVHATTEEVVLMANVNVLHQEQENFVRRISLD